MHKLAATATVAALGIACSTGALGQPYDWSGFHVGGNVDVMSLNSHWAGTDSYDGGEGPVALPFHLSNGNTSFGAGVDAGYDVQLSSIVLGVAGDWTWVNAHNTKSFVGPSGTDSVRTKLDNIETARGRVGFAMDTWLPYVTGGWAWSNLRRSFTTGSGLEGVTSDSNGWTLGAGVETMLSEHISLFGEGLYVRFHSTNGTTPISEAESITGSVRTDAVIGRVGVNFRF
jgi:opacity protein-like surface antigen